ncbi:MAG TPA: signal recognition particle-docking protein FtsY [Chromatiales bacterium]|nr:signal recognition particle-docking protein FtsY [Chromatiales bacterium]
MRLIAAFIMRGRWQAILATAGLAILALLLMPLSWPLTYLSSGAVGLVTLVQGPREGLLNAGGATALLAVLVVGVNGSGKTTTIGKLASHYRAQGLSVRLAAGDTFRAAAIEQLKIWGERTGCPVVAGKQGADSAGLAFEAVEAAKAAGDDVLLIDTAGRLHNRAELMAELQKVARVIKKVEPSAPHHVVLVLDATTGQNALTQVGTFKELVDLTGLVVTKLDGSARGGVLVALAEKYGLPVHAVGVGEGAEDFRPFTAKDFASALVGLEQNS